MDSLTHALAASIVFALIGHPELIPFAALGAIAPDADIIFQPFSSRDPGLYIFTHGGITHSIAGALATSGLAAALAMAVAAALGHDITVPLAFVASAAGALSHIGLDFLAYPGIPLLYPATDKKFTQGISAGPTPYLLFASVVYGVFLLAGKADINDPWAYVGFFVLVIAAIAVLKAYVTNRSGGMAIPGFNPLRWLIVVEKPASYVVYGYHLFRGRSPAAEFEKLRGVSPEDIRKLGGVPEVRRMRYHSYVVTATRNGESVILSDPLREHGYLWYPPYFKRIEVPDRFR